MADMETIIIGGGIAGIACALKLREAGRPYLLLSDNIGGRIAYDADCDMNFGVSFYTRNFRYAHEVLQPKAPLYPSLFDLECHLKLGPGYTTFSPAMIGALEQTLRFTRYLKNSFEPHYENFKLNCETQEVIRALEKDAFVRNLYDSGAPDVLRRLGVERTAELLVSQFVHACTGASIDKLNGLDYMICASCLFSEAMRFTFDAEDVQAELAYGSGHVRLCHVASIERCEQGWAALEEDGTRHTARNLVIATPADEARRLLRDTTGDYEIRSANELHVYKVKGSIDPAYGRHKAHLFDQSIPIATIFQQPDSTWKVVTSAPLDLAFLFEEYEVERQVDWPNALFASPSAPLDQNILLENNLGEGLFRIGDHNVFGAESAAISGVFAANAVLSR